MKIFLGVMLACMLFFLGGATAVLTQPKFHVSDPQAAGGNWSIEFQVPPCDKKIQINWPEREGDVITFYCSDMPVKER